MLRTLSALADAFDEHMLLVRIADEECFDIIKLHSGLSRLLAHYSRLLISPPLRPQETLHSLDQ